MISNNFFMDAKIKSMPTGHVCLFIGILMMCSDSSNDTVMIHERYVNDLLKSRVGAWNALLHLQELQLVTAEKVPLYKDISIEVSKEESKTKSETTASSAEESAADSPTKAPRSTFVLESFEQLQNLIPEKVWDTWHLNFDQEFIDREMNRALMWALTEPKKNRKTQMGWAKTMTKWLHSEWDKYLTKLPKESASKPPEFRI